MYIYHQDQLKNGGISNEKITEVQIIKKLEKLFPDVEYITVTITLSITRFSDNNKIKYNYSGYTSNIEIFKHLEAHYSSHTPEFTTLNKLNKYLQKTIKGYD